MKSKWIIGAGLCMEQVFNTWTRAYPQENIQRIELFPGDDDTFDFGVLDSLDPGQGTMFVAFDESLGTLKRTVQPAIEGSSGLDSFIRPSAALPPDILRMELVEAATQRGFKLESFVSPSAIVAPNAFIGSNVFIGEGAVLGLGSRIETNTVVRDGVRLGAGVHLGCSCWLEPGVLVGDGAEIGAYSILRIGAVVGPRVRIGEHCELGWARLYDQEIPSRTVFEPGLEEPIYVYGD